jgi:hypothetical protein
MSIFPFFPNYRALTGLNLHILVNMQNFIRKFEKNQKNRNSIIWDFSAQKKMAI